MRRPASVIGANVKKIARSLCRLARVAVLWPAPH
jgi:hypothetical protein